jgi:amino acid transporter
VVAFFNGFDAFFPGRFEAKTFVPPYIDIPIFLALILGYKLVKRTKVVKLQEMDLWSGKAEIDGQVWPVRKPRNVVERVWFWVA